MRTTHFTMMLGNAAVVGVVLGQLHWIAPAYAAGPTAEQLAVEVTALKSRLSQLESRSRGAPAPTAASAPLDDLHKQVAMLTQVLQVAGGSVTLKSPGTIVIDAGSALQLKAAGPSTIDIGASLKLRTGADLELKSAGTASLQGSRVALNNGTRPVAYAGGKTAGTASSHIIADGSTSVLVP
jgi:hypothetical protein